MEVIPNICEDVLIKIWQPLPCFLSQLLKCGPPLTTCYSRDHAEDDGRRLDHLKAIQAWQTTFVFICPTIIDQTPSQVTLPLFNPWMQYVFLKRMSKRKNQLIISYQKKREIKRTIFLFSHKRIKKSPFFLHLPSNFYLRPRGSEELKYIEKLRKTVEI